MCARVARPAPPCLIVSFHGVMIRALAPGPSMLRWYRFNKDLSPPVPAREIYVRHPGGKGWPEECPPMRAANAFGFDVPNPFELSFRKRRDGTWHLENEAIVTSDLEFQPERGRSGRGRGGGRAEGAPLTQVNAWFWEKGQTLPHVITDDVFTAIRNQVKVSTFLYLATDPDEILFITGVPNLPRPWRALTALVDADRYPASYPWHCVIELDPREKAITIPKGEPVCRLFTVRRADYAAQEMSRDEFDAFFRRGQEWLARHGKGPPSGMMDITGAYRKVQKKSRFEVRP